MAEKGIIRLTRFISHPPARVWAVLTEPELHARWWAKGDVRPVVGHKFTLDMGNWGEQPCEVLAVRPERFLSYSFAEGTLDTTLSWTLEPEGTGTRLTLVHEGFDLDSPLGKTALEGMGSGWPKVMAHIETVLDQAQSPRPL